jgi:hypothetical protein
MGTVPAALSRHLVELGQGRMGVHDLDGVLLAVNSCARSWRWIVRFG